MFLVTFPALNETEAFYPHNITKYTVNTSTSISILTDNSFSKFFPENDGFTIIDSPLAELPTARDLPATQIRFSNQDTLDLFRATGSGRPIYYYLHTNGEFFCASHIALLRQAGVPIDENASALAEFFVYRFIVPPLTLYKDIFQLPIGSSLQIKITGNQCVILKRTSYTPPYPAEYNLVRNNYHEHLLRLLNLDTLNFESVKDRITLLFSGGIDSSILYEIFTNYIKKNDTFSTGYPFEDPNKNIEKQYASSAAIALSAKHCYYESTAREYLLGVVESIFFAEEPVHHLQSVPLYLLFKHRIPTLVDIIICGEGADSIFGLELHSALYRGQNVLYKLLAKPPIIQILERVGPSLGIANQKISFLKELPKKEIPVSDPRSLIWSFGAYGSIDWAMKYFNVDMMGLIKSRYKMVKTVENRSFYDILSVLAVFGSTAITSSIWSKLAESQGKKLYYPFINQQFIDYGFSIGWDIKLKSKKYLLYRIAQDLGIPDLILHRSKSGFGIKPERWALPGGIFEPLIPLVTQYFDEGTIRQVQSGDITKAMTFWNILNYGIWKRLFIENEPLDRLIDELEMSIRSSPSAIK